MNLLQAPMDFPMITMQQQQVTNFPQVNMAAMEQQLHLTTQQQQAMLNQHPVL